MAERTVAQLRQGKRLLIKREVRSAMPGSWTCSACGFFNRPGPLCERCGQALHYQLDPPLDTPRRPELLLLPEFFSLLLWLFVLLAGSFLYLPPFARLTGLAAYWLLLHLAVFAPLSLGAARNLAFARTFYRVKLEVPPHARSGTEFEVVMQLLPYSEARGVHITVSLREFWFDERSRLRSRRYSSLQLNRGAPLRGRRLHEFRARILAPVPRRRYLSLQNEVRLSLYRLLGRFLPELGFATAHLRPEGGWYVQLRLRRGLFVKSFEQRVLLYSPGPDLLVG